MLHQILHFLSQIESFFWSYIGAYILIGFGAYLTVKSNFMQIRVLSNIPKILSDLRNLGAQNSSKNEGLHPFRLYFASVGGTIGLGNLVSIATAVTIGGPGAIVWMWLATFIGMLIKYCDIYLGIKYRVKDPVSGYDGGLLYYLQKAYSGRTVPIIAGILLCFYGVEIFQFKVVVTGVSEAFSIDQRMVLLVFTAIVIYTGVGGMKRLSGICGFMMPVFMLTYTGMCLLIIANYWQSLPDLFYQILKYSITPHAAVGGFVGSTIFATIHHGTARAVYSGDIGIGYDSVVFSETKVNNPEIQGSLVMLGSIVDVLSSTLTLLVLLVTNVWQDGSITELSGYITKALSMHFPYVKYIVALLFLFAGYPVVLAYFTVGMKCAHYINAKVGRLVYICYAMIAFVLTLYVEQVNLIMLMSLAGGALLTINIIAMYILRKEIKFI